MLQRLLSRRSISMAAASVAGGAGAIAYLSSHSSSSEPHSDAKSSLSEFQRAPPMRRGSIDVMQPMSQPGVSEDSPVFVGICGGTGSGKTTVAESIARRLQGHGDRVTHISHDNYYKPLENLSLKERTKQNFDHPDSLDTALMVQHLAELKAGRRVNIPTYDFATYGPGVPETIEKAPARVVLVEGILIYDHPQLRDLLDIKIFVDTDADVRFIRRLKRDLQDRGREVGAVIEQYLETVRPMHNQFVEPSKRYADVIIPTGLNSVALEMVIARLEQILAAEPQSGSTGTATA
eukprot:jgi/Chrpa1/2495/Chrysochromulina_OHIO_Genome00001343-RA